MKSTSINTIINAESESKFLNLNSQQQNNNNEVKYKLLSTSFSQDPYSDYPCYKVAQYSDGETNLKFF